MIAPNLCSIVWSITYLFYTLKNIDYLCSIIMRAERLILLGKCTSATFNNHKYVYICKLKDVHRYGGVLCK